MYIQGIFTVACVNAIATIGLAVFTGFTGLFSLGHAAFLAIGAYTACILTQVYKAPFALALACGALVPVVVGFLVGIPTLRARLRGDYFAIATLGFGEAVRVILENLELTQGARGLPGISLLTSLPLALVVLAGVTLLARCFLVSKYGRNAVAVREDAIAAEMVGINVFRTRMLSLAISCACAGLAGGLQGHYLGFIQPAMFTSVQSTQLTAAVVCGGMGSLSGPIIAAMLFVAVPELLRMAAMWRLAFYGLLLVSIVVLRPEGLLGYAELNPVRIWRSLGVRGEKKWFH